MPRSLLAAVSLVAALGLAPAALAAPTTYGGVTFPDGDVSFADVVVSYVPGTGVSTAHDDPADALGPPNYVGDTNYVSLGWGGTLVLQFTDNALTTSGDAAADLHVFEIGSAVEWMQIAISTNGSSWIDLGTLKGQPTSIDIDAVAGVVQGAKYSFVRIIDDNRQQSGSPYAGADIDAVGAISSTAPVPLPAAGWLLAGGLGGLAALRRKRGTAIRG